MGFTFELRHIQKEKSMHHDLPTPHGGRWETMIKTLFVAMILTIIGVFVWTQAPKRVPDLLQGQEAMILKQAEDVRTSYVARGGNWSVDESVLARNRLIELIDTVPRQNIAVREQIQSMITDVVRHALDERSPSSDASKAEQFRSLVAYQELQYAFTSAQPATRQPIGTTALLRGIAKLGLGLVALYFLFVPFALLCLFARMRTFGYRVLDEIVYGWRNLIVSSAFWPIGLGEYPRDTAEAIRRAGIKMEFRIRLNKGWRDTFTPSEARQLEALVRAPKAQLAERLDAIARIPLHALLRARFAIAVSMFLGLFLAPFSAARAQPRTSGDAKSKEDAAQVKEEPLPIEVSGHILVDSDLTEPTLSLSNAFVIVKAHPLDWMDAKVMLNLAPTPVLLDAMGTIKLWNWPLTVSVGQFAQKTASFVPPPFQERLIGGPLATSYLALRDIGIEVSGTHDWFRWALAGLSGAGKNVPDDNAQKDVLAWAAIGPFGPLRFQMAWQFGEQLDGFRYRTTGNATLDLKPFTLDVVGAYQSFAGAQSMAVSSMFGWRVHENLDFAAGYDAVVSKQPDRWLRMQATYLTAEDRFRAGLMYGVRPDSKEHSLAARLQVSF
jgi:hypothetical protein